VNLKFQLSRLVLEIVRLEKEIKFLKERLSELENKKSLREKLFG